MESKLRFFFYFRTKSLPTLTYFSLRAPLERNILYNVRYRFVYGMYTFMVFWFMSGQDMCESSREKIAMLGNRYYTLILKV